jgi:hypothetical protein
MIVGTVFHAQILSLLPVQSGTTTSVVTKVSGVLCGGRPMDIASCVLKTPMDKLVAAVLTPLVLIPLVMLLTHVVVGRMTVITHKYIRTHFRMRRTNEIE